MTEGEKAILSEIRSIRDHVDDGFRECREDIRKVHARIDTTNTAVGEVQGVALISKTKIGSFAAGMVFIFTCIAGTISHYVGTHFK